MNVADLSIPALREKAQRIVAAVEADPRAYTTFKGRRWSRDRTIVAVPLSHRWRLIFLDCGRFLRFKELLSHEDYNNAYRVLG